MTKQEIVNELVARFGNLVTRKQIVEFVNSKGAAIEGGRVPAGVDFPHWITNNKAIRSGRGVYDLTKLNLKNTTSTVDTTEDVGTASTGATR